MDFSMNSYLTLILLLLCFIKFKNHFKTITTVLAAPQNQPSLLDHPAQLFAAQWRRSRRKDRKPAAAITLLYKQVPVNITAIVKTLSCCQYCHKDRLHAVIQQRSNLCQRNLTQSRKSFTLRSENRVTHAVPPVPCPTMSTRSRKDRRLCPRCCHLGSCARKVAPCVRWPATGITAHSL